MRRREFLRSAAAALGLGGLTGGALPATPGTVPVTARESDSGGRDSRRISGRRDSRRISGRKSGTETANGGRTAGAGSESGTDTGASGFAPLGHVEIERAAEAVPSRDGTHAFVANRSGVHSVDVSDPASPEIVATREHILESESVPMRKVMDCKVHGERLLVVAPGNPAEDSYHGLALFDVSDPADPTLTRSYRTTYSIHNCFLDGRLAYLVRGSGFEIVDVGRKRPRRVGRWDVTEVDEAFGGVDRLLRNAHDVYVGDGRAYVANWDLGTFVVDVSDPTDPEHLATVSDRPVAHLQAPENRDEFLEPPGNDHYVQPSDDGRLLAIGMETWTVDPTADGDDPGGPSGIELWNISDLDAPSQVGAIDPPAPPEGDRAIRDEADGYWTTAHNFDLVGDYLYSSWYQGGVRVHDVSDPASPELLAAWEDGETASFWTAKLAVAGEYFVASDEGAYDDRTGGLYTFPDPSDLSRGSTPDPTPGWTPTATPTPPVTTTRSTTAPGETTTRSTPSPAEIDHDTTTPTPAPAPTDGATTTTGESGHGFGVLAGLSAAGLGTWWLLGGRDEE